ncbi:MAG: hypothetical protein SGJ00_06365 [bacterium]|nr:hypothetical protein [bacterium]
MTSKYEQIPSIIFDLINKYSFAELNIVQQAEVIIWFEPNEYNELHEIAVVVNHSKPSATSRKETIKQTLLQQFKAQKRAQKPWFKTEIALWKVAATMLLVSIFIFTWLRYPSQKTMSLSPLLAQIDTVYIEKENHFAQAIIYDTIFIKHGNKANAKSAYIGSDRKNSSGKISLTEISNIRVQSLTEIDATPNQIRGNSLKDDTLLSTFGIVRL